MSNHWIKISGTDYEKVNDGSMTKVVEPAVYKLVFPTPVRNWYLSKVSANYPLPFKVYGINTKVLSRIKSAWTNLDGNLSVLLNGLKGTGKTVTAQILANWAIENKMPVITISEYNHCIEDCINNLKQDAVILIDEFEKNFHNNVTPETEDPTPQQLMLSILDGLSRTNHRRFFLMTSNEKKLDKNMLDRPSRIRYIFEFDKMEENVIQEILDDILVEDVKHLRNDAMEYFSKIETVSIDSVKVVAQEINVFKESPFEFKSFINLSDRKVMYYDVVLIDPETRKIFKVMKSELPYRQYEYVQTYVDKFGTRTYDGDNILIKNRISNSEYFGSASASVKDTEVYSLFNKSFVLQAMKELKGDDTYLYNPLKRVSLCHRNEDVLAMAPKMNKEDVKDYIQRMIDEEKDFPDSEGARDFIIRFEPNYDTEIISNGMDA